MAGEGLDGGVLDNPDAPADGGGVAEEVSGSSGDESDGEGWD